MVEKGKTVREKENEGKQGKDIVEESGEWLKEGDETWRRAVEEGRDDGSGLVTDKWKNGWM